MRHISKEEPLSIPNLMGYLRLITVPMFVWLYLKASTDADCYRAAVVTDISSVADMSNEMIAREFNMVTEFGKFLDFLTDKLTRGATPFCLWSRYPLILPLLVLFVPREGLMLITGAVKLWGGRKLSDAKWFGKCCTALLSVVLFLLLLFPHISLVAVSVLTLLCAAAMFIALLLYILMFRSI